jgi:hypothetical protein
MRVVLLLFFLLASCIQGAFAALNNDNPLTNPDLPPTVRANLESRILQWLCPRIKVTASNYIRSRLYPLSSSLSGSLSSIPAPRKWGLFDFSYIGTPLYLEPFLFERTKLQSWLEQLTPAKKQRLDDALIVSIAAYIKTHPNVFMVCCVFAQHSKVTWGDPFVCVFSIYPDLNDSFSVQLLPPLYPDELWLISECPQNSWVEEAPEFFICQTKTAASGVVARYVSDISSVTYSHGGSQFVLTPKKPVFWSN